MKSPFPGMDPYLEKHWGDVHTRLITYASDHLQPSLPKELRARVQERVVVESPGTNGTRDICPDVHVVEHGQKRKAAHKKASVAVAEPLLIDLDDEPETQRFIEIMNDGKRVVTVIEFLSLSNKLPGPGMRLYQQKQGELGCSRVSLVEIDLLRDGLHALLVPAHLIPQSGDTTYKACVRRSWRPGRLEYYPMPLDKKLPAIKIPLRSTDKDVRLDLQAVLDEAYRKGGYDDIDYTVDADPPLSGKDAAWTDKLLRRKKLRH